MEPVTISLLTYCTDTGSLEALGSFISMVLDIVAAVLMAVTVAASLLFIRDKVGTKNLKKKA